MIRFCGSTLAIPGRLWQTKSESASWVSNMSRIVSLLLLSLAMIYVGNYYAHRNISSQQNSTSGSLFANNELARKKLKRLKDLRKQTPSKSTYQAKRKNKFQKRLKERIYQLEEAFLEADNNFELIEKIRNEITFLRSELNLGPTNLQLWPVSKIYYFLIEFNLSPAEVNRVSPTYLGVTDGEWQDMKEKWESPNYYTVILNYKGLNQTEANFRALAGQYQ